jgi:mandelamide amidase
VVLGIVSVALGTDTAGSIRIPASFCGCVGYKPSLHRYASQGVVPLSCSRDTVGLMAMSVADILRVDSVLAAVSREDDELTKQSLEGGLRKLRVGVPRGKILGFL